MLVTFPTSLPDAEDRTRHCGSTLSAIAGQFCPPIPASHTALARASCTRFAQIQPSRPSRVLGIAPSPSLTSFSRASSFTGFPARPSFERLPGTPLLREASRHTLLREASRQSSQTRTRNGKSKLEGESEPEKERTRRRERSQTRGRNKRGRTARLRYAR